MKNSQRTGGLANWSIQHPVAVIMLSLTVLVIGLFSFDRLNINLLPDIIYPDVRIRIIETGTPTKIMEDKFTRQLEEQLAITEGAIRIESDTSEGRTAVNLIFDYGTDIDRALQDASTRLDRAKRFLPITADPPIIYKRDPSQLPVMELVISSSTRNSIDLRSWVDYEFSKWFLNIKGIAAAEVGGGLVREIQIIIDQEKLASAGLTITDIQSLLKMENQSISSGVLYMNTQKISTRTEARFKSIEDIANLSLVLPSDDLVIKNKQLKLKDVADVIDAHQDEKLRVRLNQQPGIKLSLQKQPEANTIDVAQRVHKQLNWFKSQHLLPPDIQVEVVGDQAIYIRHALNNASYAALSGALLAMLVVYIFLRDIRRTLIIATAIPLALFITFFIMGLYNISLNIMSLGGIALGVGLLVDNTIVMLENISRHQMAGEPSDVAATTAATEVTGAITASTTTNLVAVIPFLFIGGLIGLLFSELIITLSASIIASLVVALTLIPALGAKLNSPKNHHKNILFNKIQYLYKTLLKRCLPYSFLFISVFIGLFIFSIFQLNNARDTFFPAMDEGNISIRLSTETGTRLDEFDKTLQRVEQLVLQQNDVESAFVISGGFIYGRAQYQSSNNGAINVQLKPLLERNNISSKQWIKKIKRKIKILQLTGYKVRIKVKGVRGISTSRGDEDFSLRIQGPEISVLSDIADTIIKKLAVIPELENLKHTYESQSNELVININRQRAADLNIKAEDIGKALQLALSGKVSSKYLEYDREFDIRVRLKRNLIKSIPDIKNTIISIQQGKKIRLLDVANVEILTVPGNIKRENQLRINEISATIDEATDYRKLNQHVFELIDQTPIPDGYLIYDGGSLDTLQKNESNSYILLALAIFLVFVVMAIQYESLTNPLIIIAAVPFTLIGVYLAIEFSLDQQLSMPARLGIIMLAGIVVNNAIVLIEQVEICREQGMDNLSAILEATSLRLRPILMTTLTSVLGMLPLALGVNEGAELLKPLATIIVYGLSFSLLVSLLLVPMFYLLVHREKPLQR